MDLLPLEIVENVVVNMDNATRRRFSSTAKSYRIFCPKHLLNITTKTDRFFVRLSNCHNIYRFINYGLACTSQNIVEYTKYDLRNQNNDTIDLALLLDFLELKMRYNSTRGYYFDFQIIGPHICNDISANKDICMARILLFSPEYGDYHDLRHPANNELIIARYLEDEVINFKTPHISLPITSFLTSINMLKNYPDTYKYCDYSSDKFHDMVRVNIYEPTETNSTLSDYILKLPAITDNEWRCIIFQIVYTLAIILERYPEFRHNNLTTHSIHIYQKPDIDNWKCTYIYEDLVYLLYPAHVGIKITDFYFASVGGYSENHIIDSTWGLNNGVTKKANQYYDIHLFLNRLLQCHYDKIPNETREFIESVVPPEFRYGGRHVNLSGRLIDDIEYTTPAKILLTSTYFDTMIM